MFVQLTKDYFGQTAGQRVDVDEPHARQLIRQGVAEPLADDPAAPLVAAALERATGRLSESVSRAVSTALKQVEHAQTQARRHAVPAVFGEAGQGDARHNFGDWLIHVAKQDTRYLEKEYGSYQSKTALAESSGAAGGYVVPPQFAQQLLTVAAEETFIRAKAFVQPMSTAALQFPYLDITTVQAAGVTPLLGGVSLNWTEEAQSRTETEPQFKMLELKAHELSGYAVSSNVLLQDANFGLEKFLVTIFGKAIGWYEEFAFLQGNGVGKPQGILSCSAALAVNRANAGKFQYADAATMLSKLLPSSQRRALWAMHPYVIAQAVQLADASGRLVWVPNSGGAQDKVPGYLFNLPIFVTEKVPALGTRGDVSLIDPGMYVIGDRMEIEVAASEHVNFLKNQMTWRVVERVDGQPWLDKPVTLQDGSTQVSPFVILN